MNRGPLDLQSNALPLSYTPDEDVSYLLCYYHYYFYSFYVFCRLSVFLSYYFIHIYYLLIQYNDSLGSYVEFSLA